VASEQAIEKGLKARAAQRAEKSAAAEPGRLAKDQARRKAYVASEQAIEEGLAARKTKESRKRAAKESGQLARDQARTEDTRTREPIDVAQDAQ
jgi:hypothetical protein